MVHQGGSGSAVPASVSGIPEMGAVPDTDRENAVGSVEAESPPDESGCSSEGSSSLGGEGLSSGGGSSVAVTVESGVVNGGRFDGRGLEELRDWERQYRRDERQVKLLLGLGPNDPLPKCRARSKKKVKEFLAAGDATHAEKGHRCSECGCQRTAGYGTDHWGWGYCYDHERIFGPKAAERMAKRHFLSLTEHPSIYRTVDRFTETVKKDALDAEGRASLEEELRILRGRMSELNAALDGETLLYEKGGPADGGGTIRMTDSTRIKLANDTARAIASLAKIHMDMRQRDAILLDDFKIWLSRLWEMMREVARLIETNQLFGKRAIEERLRQELRLLGMPGRK